jgi:hypothetical protein
VSLKHKTDSLMPAWDTQQDPILMGKSGATVIKLNKIQNLWSHDFDKGARTIQTRKDRSFQKMVLWDSWISNCKRTMLGPSTLYYV